MANQIKANQFNAIGSNHKKELVYLFSLLNSSTNNVIIRNLLKNDNEKDFLLSTTSIKNFVRIPQIKKENQFIKDEIIKRTEKMLDLEDCQLRDLVDFSNITRQKFDSVEVRGNNLILTRNGEDYKAPVKSKKDVVKAVLKENFGEKSLLPGEVVLSELKHLMALDENLQESLKDYIDDLVFALYFNVPVKKVGISLAVRIKEMCLKNEFYGYIQKERRKKIK
ncbi:MAG: hypothetical protein KAT56_01670 [Sedimentisphaerales bacterium]|nr:hypothetical protein [Sedimentisphaerales bacterium]